MIATKKPQLHPACAEWPKMSECELEDLARDIMLKGQLEDIVLTADGRILDGSNRWDACERAGTDPKTTRYAGDDPIGFVISKNKHRRHMEPGPLAMVVAALVNMKPHRPAEETPLAERSYSTKHAAKDSGLSRSTIDNARAVLNHGAQNVVEMVKNGQVSVRTASDAVKSHPKEAQASWTAKDVKREGHKVTDAHPSAQRRKALKQQPKSAPEVSNPSKPKPPESIPTVPDHIRIREYPENRVETHNGVSQVRECSAKGFYLVNLYLTKKEIVFLNRALNKESSETEYEMSAKCLAKSLRERNYQLTNLNHIH